MSVSKKSDGRWLVDVRPAGRNGPRIRRFARNQNEGLALEKYLIAKNEEQQKRKLEKIDRRQLSELVPIWWEAYGITLKDGDNNKRHIELIIERLNNPCACDLTPGMFYNYRAERLAGKWPRETIGAGRSSGGRYRCPFF